MKKTLGFLSAIALSGSAYANVNVGGYVDAGYNWANTTPKTSAFALNEGALYFTGESAATSFVLDIGFNTAGLTAEQAYVTAGYDSGFSWSLGVWDTVLGSESNDSVDRHFLKGGLLSSKITVDTETGLLLGYDLSDMLGLKLWVSNGAVSGNVDNPAFGFLVSTKTDGMNARVGGRFEDGAYLIDVGADTTFGAIHAGAQLLLAKAASGADSAMGFGVEAGTEIAEGTTFDVGFDWENGKFTGVAGAKTMEFRAGPRFVMSDALTVKADWSMQKATGGNAAQNIAVAGIYKF